jgi:hypothetical protein
VIGLPSSFEVVPLIFSGTFFMISGIVYGSFPLSILDSFV